MAMARRSVRVRGGVSRPSVSSACCSGAGGNTAKRRSIRTQGYGLLGNLHHVTRRKRENVVRGRKALSSARGAAAATSQKVATPTAASSSPAQSLTVSKLSKAFATTAVLLKDVSFTVNQGERVGLVGWNGAGKTTVLRIIRGEMEADAGDVRMMKNAKVASLNQEFDLNEASTVRHAFRSASPSAVHVIERTEEVQQQLERLDMNHGDDDAHERVDTSAELGSLLDELEELRKKGQSLGIERLDSSIDRMMPKLGFVERDSARLVRELSGGWQMRIALGKILLQEPDVLLLDEPTNHIDAKTADWLEAYLRSLSMPMVIVSHDRFFLDQICTKIVEIDRGVSHTWKGNYSEFMRQKRERDSQMMIAFDRNQKEIQKADEMIRRLSSQGGAGGRIEAARREKQRLIDLELKKPFVPKKRSFSFPQTRAGNGSGLVSGNPMLVQNLNHSYPIDDDVPESSSGNNTEPPQMKPIFTDAELRIEFGERVALIGANGAGKSTLLRLLLGMEEPSGGGRIELGVENKDEIGFFAQNQAETLDLSLTVFETLNQLAVDMTAAEVKAVLGQFAFRGTSIDARVESLSGGEKARLSLAKFMLTSNLKVLILDEPTNHLDIPSKEMLENALKSFQGTVIAVSHDRYFLRSISTKVVEVTDGTMVSYEGGYDVYADANSDEKKLDTKRKEKDREEELKSVKSKSKMSKAEKLAMKKMKAKAFNAGKTTKSTSRKTMKNAKRWT